MMQLTITLLAALLPLTGGPLSGTWIGSIGEKQDDGTLADRGSAYLQLQQTDTITGSVGPSSNDAHSIENVSFSRDELKFSTRYVDPESKQTVTWSFDLRVSGDSMKGTGTGSRGGHSWTMEIRLSRREMAAR